MKKKKRTNKKFYSLFLFFIFSISIGYAFLSSSTSILGSIDIKGNTWDAHYSNLKVKVGSVMPNTSPNMVSVGSPINFNVSLINPGDFYEFTVDVVNDGTVDMKIDSVNVTPVLDDTQKGYIDYIVSYDNGEEIVKNQIVPEGESIRLKVKVLYKTDYTGQYTTFKNINCSVKLNYSPSNNVESEISNNGKLITANGDINDIGTIVTIGSEKFYTVGTEGNNVKLFSMYNLSTGNVCTSKRDCAPFEGATGKQDSTLIGEPLDKSYPRYGVTSFSSGLNNVYSGSLVEGYVNDYKTLLESEYGIEVVDARLILKEELEQEEIGCSFDNWTCDGAVEWIFSTLYWTGTGSSASTIMTVQRDFSLVGTSSNTATTYGVRPVIIVSKSLFDESVGGRPINVVSGSGLNLSDEVCIGTECFYVMYSDETSVTMLSKFNLEVGYYCSSSINENCVLIENPSGLQDPLMIGYNNSDGPRYGTLNFSANVYWDSGGLKPQYGSGYPAPNIIDSNSYLYNHIVNYKNYLLNLGVRINEVRLINNTEGSSLYNSNAPDWVYSTSYWCGYAFGPLNVPFRGVGRRTGGASVTIKYSYGIRPVVVLPIDYFV